MSKLVARKPGAPGKDIEAFIQGAPDGGAPAAKVQAPAPVLKRKASRKEPISLTIDPDLLDEIDRAAAGLGISRAAAFALAASRFVAAEKREANQ